MREERGRSQRQIYARDINRVRDAIEGTHSPFQASVAGEFKIRPFRELVERTGEYQSGLAELWDNMVNDAIRKAEEREREFDLIPTLYRYAERLIDLAAQYTGVRKEEYDAWCRARMDGLLTRQARWS